MKEALLKLSGAGLSEGIKLIDTSRCKHLCTLMDAVQGLSFLHPAYRNLPEILSGVGCPWPMKFVKRQEIR